MALTIKHGWVILLWKRPKIDTEWRLTAKQLIFAKCTLSHSVASLLSSNTLFAFAAPKHVGSAFLKITSPIWYCYNIWSMIWQTYRHKTAHRCRPNNRLRCRIFWKKEHTVQTVCKQSGRRCNLLQNNFLLKNKLTFFGMKLHTTVLFIFFQRAIVLAIATSINVNALLGNTTCKLLIGAICKLAPLISWSEKNKILDKSPHRPLPHPRTFLL